MDRGRTVFVRHHLSPSARSYNPDVRTTGSEENFSVCFFGTYRANYVRNEVMIAGLEANGITVHRCHAQLWHSVDDRVAQAAGGWMRPTFVLRVVKAYWKLLRRHRHVPHYDVMLIGYPGHFDTILGRFLAARRDKLVALDVLMSLHLIAVGSWTNHGLRPAGAAGVDENVDRLTISGHEIAAKVLARRSRVMRSPWKRQNGDLEA